MLDNLFFYELYENRNKKVNEFDEINFLELNLNDFKDQKFQHLICCLCLDKIFGYYDVLIIGLIFEMFSF